MHDTLSSSKSTGYQLHGKIQESWYEELLHYKAKPLSKSSSYSTAGYTRVAAAYRKNALFMFFNSDKTNVGITTLEVYFATPPPAVALVSNYQIMQ